MKAVVLKGVKQMETLDVPVHELQADEVMIEVICCGICGTDQHIYHGNPGSAQVQPPVILGHELAGVITKIGQGVAGFNIGDRVSIDPNLYCRQCSYCRSGREHLCDHLQAIGVTRDGGMGQFCAVPARNCYLIPDSMSFEEAALVEPLGCVLHGFRKLQFSPLSKVLIIGGGFIGQLFTQLAKREHVSRIVVSEPVESKYSLLFGLGADEVVQPLSAGTADSIGSGYDVVIECVGRKESMELACAAARKGGQVLLFGVSSPKTSISINPFEVFSKELVIRGSFINPCTHEEAISLIDQGVVQVQSLISHRFDPDEVPAAMELYPTLQVSKGVIKYGGTERAVWSD
ncbi:zinc-dependent alcohol dehydrogenase family protein [Cohnella faecalis]|uniref:Theronine dehydrogenase n=1 Tax=Cohnella faecalis TaxID=2315694 RepID=A0A398CEA8_9BACL|nr:zinc-dependent alcohol dehydrogenase family protein [Cohnella faecalis]RIE00192.1 theronine dehydrogenase [Cohnella faecalis]